MKQQEERQYDLTYYTHKLMTREGFLTLSMGAMASAGALAVGIPIIGYVLGPVIQQSPKKWRKVRLTAPDGTLGEVVRTETIPLGQTREVAFPNADPVPWAGATAMNASWLRRTGAEEFIAFSINCTHLDCPVHYVSGAHLFLCPC